MKDFILIIGLLISCGVSAQEYKHKYSKKEKITTSKDNKKALLVEGYEKTELRQTKKIGNTYYYKDYKGRTVKVKKSYSGKSVIVDDGKKYKK